MTVLIALLRLCPLFLGLLLVRPGPGAIGAGLHVQRALLYLPVFVLWYGALGVVPLIMKSRGASVGGRKKLIGKPFDVVLLATFLVLSAGALLTLQYFRQHVSDEVFYLATGVMAAIALEQMFSSRNWRLAGVFAGLLGYSALGYLSFVVLARSWDWQALVFAAGFGFMVTALRTAQQLAVLSLGDYSGSLKGREPQLYARPSGMFGRLSFVYPFFVCLAALCPATLAFFGFLPKPFTLLMIIVPFSSGLIGKLQTARQHQKLPPDFLRETVWVTCLYFLVTLVLFFSTALI